MLSIPPIQRFNYPQVEKRISTSSLSAFANQGSISQGDSLTFSGNCFSSPSPAPSGKKSHSHHHASNQQPRNVRFLTSDGQDFEQYWRRQGLQDFQISQMKKQGLRNQPASYLPGNSQASPNFDVSLQRSKSNSSPERPGTPHEQSMLALQKERLAREENQTAVQVFLARIYLYCTHQLRPENSSLMRSEVTKFAIPLSPGKEFYRGMLLSASQLRLILTYAEGDEARSLRQVLGIPEPTHPYPQLVKHLLHGFPVGGGKYSHHGITSISTLPNMAAKYANKAYQKLGVTPKEWDWGWGLGLAELLTRQGFVPVVVTIVNDDRDRAKGFVIEKNYFKAKHEIILDYTNDYSLAENPLSARHGMLQLRIHARHL